MATFSNSNPRSQIQTEVVTPLSATRPLALRLLPTSDAPTIDAMNVFERFSREDHVLFMHSAMKHSELGRFSFLTFSPFEWLSLKNCSNSTDEDSPISKANETSSAKSALAAGPQPFQQLRALLRDYQLDFIRELPPFQGGAAGLLSYELNRWFENIPESANREFDTPVMAIGFYDVVLSWDHRSGECFLISTGFPELELERRIKRATEQAEHVLSRLATIAKPQAEATTDSRPLNRSELATCYETRYGEKVLSNFSNEQYLEAVARSIEYVKAGDIFQVNLSQRLLAPFDESPVELFKRSCQTNESTFAAYFDLGESQIVSASPERLVNIHDGVVEARPIKGTFPTMHSPEANLYSGDHLRASRKDRAENIMIVDLLRNDLSKVCDPDSVQVKQLCEVETYRYVHHLVSVVQGRLEEGKAGVDLLEAVFPGGSITGAPKVRAMEIIAELEPTARGPYCGSLGYLGFNGELDFNILIRTFTVDRGWCQFPVGGGIVANSVPRLELEETWDKAKGLLKALGVVN